MVQLDRRSMETGFVNITHNYFDFKKGIFDPLISLEDARRKVHDDKLMEIYSEKFDVKHKAKGKIYDKDDKEKAGFELIE